MRMFLLMLMLLVGFVSPVVGGDEADAILGVWATKETENGYAHVEISKDGDRYRGQIVWLSQPNYPADDKQGMGGQPKVDRENRAEELRDRPLLGLWILKEFKYKAKGKWNWKKGRIYDPENGKTYKSTMRLKKDDVLRLRGYVFIFGRSTEWHRMKADTDGG